MSLIDEESEERLPPEVGVRVVYLGPVAPHWQVEGVYGDQTVVEEFRHRTLARLQLLPPHDPQFGRNQARVERDAERENLELSWDLGVPADSDDGGDGDSADGDGADGADGADSADGDAADSDADSADSDADSADSDADSADSDADSADSDADSADSDAADDADAENDSEDEDK